MVVGATVRTLGAWPSGWRHPDAHRDPAGDPRVLRSLALTAESAGLHFLYFGDWLATGPEFELTDPYLLARIEPLAAISYLSAVTERIGLIATVTSAHSEPYSTARASASIDLLSGGRAGLSLSSGAEPRSAANFGRTNVHPDEDRIEAAGEFIEILRGLWDSWDDDAFVADAATGRLIDHEGVRQLGYVGRHFSSAGPLNVARPPQGHPIVSVVGSAPGARALAARQADISFLAPNSLAEAIDVYRATKEQARYLGRDPAHFLLITPILPIVAETREEAWKIYDDLVGLVPVETAAGVDAGVALPANRTIRRLAGVLGVSLNGVIIDEAVPATIAARFSPLGAELVALVNSRSGRTIGGYRPVTYRHLLVAHAVAAPVLVGSGIDVADYLESWFLASATDGFTVLSAYLGGQFEAFTALVIPELKRRGVFPENYAGATLRENLGLPRPANTLRSAAFGSERSPLLRKR
ncbi:NtaA/DmoA family FMN-dependent monooxygenase [Lacisediminihabitans profunda]|uniref:NtaA/DmoA family FMN-dependent monooxygenase n=2 Tax=Lacisediminihabitans profunda TaxID=2594790 RepID=A0A5C8UV46_9MICO|nr:NtaA/DmoA family FMN-dependent monooxygenase [Lacisediminihabitans profunda]